MITTYDYTQSDNNCFLVKHDNNFYLDDYVESIDIDYSNHNIKITYHGNTNIKITDKIILEIYDKFGILQDTQIFDNLTCIEKSNNYVIYKS